MMDISQLATDRGCLLSWIAMESTPAQPSRLRISARTVAINSPFDKIDVDIFIHYTAAATDIGRAGRRDYKHLVAPNQTFFALSFGSVLPKIAAVPKRHDHQLMPV